ncbi:nucleolar complex protein 3 homolog [Dendronephthya gigantea]|uniref:nucleolar complex protein 3 homolog n=1 Tax=Dendronephthya gigantea TaxID=151771 RepID=UPI00106D7B8A|nr:nucleolar complex protein 3 homolog [Dendronephthya gigantea]
MGKKGRAKPKQKQTGKKRSKGKQSCASRISGVKKLREDNAGNKYVGKLEDYEPIRKRDSDDEQEGESSDIDEGDLDVFHHPQTDFKFLASVDLQENSKLNKKKRKLLENEEETYEKKPRLMAKAWKSEEYARLPLKNETGVIRQSYDHVENEETPDPLCFVEGCPKQEDTKDSQNEDMIAAELSAVDLLKLRQEKIEAKKALISELVSSVLEDTQANIDKLGEMNKLCQEKDSDISLTVRKLAIVSQLEVFKDIIPGYRIRPLSESEQNVKVSKDVKKVRHFEEGLLRSYQRYLEILEQTIKEKKKYRGSRKHLGKGLPMIALQCLCDLLKNVPHFNFRTNIMAVLVPKMNDQSTHGEISSLCCETVQSIFKTDSVGEISLEIVQLINKLVKNQSFKVKPCVLETFISLRLHDAELGGKGKENEQRPKSGNKMEKMKKKKMSKNDRKRQKELKKIERELQEAEAVEGKEKSRRMQTEIIKLVFSIYFRVLKSADVSPLLAPVLAGLSKFTHLINIDFFGDLMIVLKNLVTSEDISSRNKLHCILTAFKILSGQGEALNIDPQTFYCHLYSTLLDIDKAGDIKIALDCLDVMVNKRRKQVSIQRLLSYIKRLCTVSLYQSTSTSLALLSFARSFLQMNAKSGIILDNDCAGSGVFRPEIKDPEYSNADSTTLWELAVFQKHYETVLRNYASHISLGNPSHTPGGLSNQLARKNPMELLEEFREDKQLDDLLNNPLRMKKQSSVKTSRTTEFRTKAIQENVDTCLSWLEKRKRKNDFREVAINIP